MPRSRVVVHTPRRRKSWVEFLAIRLEGTADATLQGTGLAFSEAGSTVLRMLGSYTINPAAAPGAGDGCTIGVGIAFVSSDAFAAGAASLPEPLGDPEYPWLYWASHSFDFVSTSSVPGDQVPSGALRHSFDLKSQRKAAGGTTLTQIVQYENLLGDPPMTIFLAQMRVLLALP